MKTEEEVAIPVDKVTLKGNLAVPKQAQGIVLFAHGSGSSRFSPRNRYVAQVLQEGGLATLLIDLLTEHEEAINMRTGNLRFDIELLAERLIAAAQWLKNHTTTKDLPIGYFGSSTGAGAALIAAAKHPDYVSAVVSRGGRPDLAMRYLPKVEAPLLLIVGENDIPVIEMNKEAMQQLRVEMNLEIIPGATHLFEEPGALEKVAQLGTAWFSLYLKKIK
jgi:dienelactone hydrolase